MEDDTVQIVEWGERAGTALDPDAIHVRLTPGEGDERRISIRLPAQVDLFDLDLGVEAE